MNGNGNGNGKKERNMKRQIIMTAILVVAPFVGGCGYLAASADVDAALQVAAKVNLANVRTAAVDNDNEHRKVDAGLEADLTARIKASAGGEAAAAILEGYRKQKAVLAQARAVEGERYMKIVDNASLITELIDQRLALSARWNALFGRIPAISHLKAIAEVESRRYIESISADTRSTP